MTSLGKNGEQGEKVWGKQIISSPTVLTILQKRETVERTKTTNY